MEVAAVVAAVVVVLVILFDQLEQLSKPYWYICYATNKYVVYSDAPVCASIVNTVNYVQQNCYYD